MKLNLDGDIKDVRFLLDKLIKEQTNPEETKGILLTWIDILSNAMKEHEEGTVHYKRLDSVRSFIEQTVSRT